MTHSDFGSVATPSLSDFASRLLRVLNPAPVRFLQAPHAQRPVPSVALTRSLSVLHPGSSDISRQVRPLKCDVCKLVRNAPSKDLEASR